MPCSGGSPHYQALLVSCYNSELNLSKAYDRISLLYLGILLIHLGFSLPLVKWIMWYVSSTLFFVFINGFASSFFKPSRGLRQGYHLSSYIFLLVVEGISRLIKKAKR